MRILIIEDDRDAAGYLATVGYEDFFKHIPWNRLHHGEHGEHGEGQGENAC